VVLISTAAHLVDATNWLPAPVRPVARWAGPSLLRGSASGRRAALIEWVRASASDLAFLTTRFIAFGDPDVSPTVVDFLERVIRATPIEVVADFYVALLEHDKRLSLSTVGRVPTVVIAGEVDRLIPVDHAASLASAIPGATLMRVPGAGHMVILERPEVVTEAIADLTAMALDQPRARRMKRRSA
jgi:pimeloyl-ACP methyl ester carboxylesterase